ncbi:MAG: hypothetical protein LKM32_14160 [Chiayiivirga sp.]|jgi:hypothetical protein|uniref:hypothetical protein n=1 Tax=Chiayiivirga sp. TaxID=2041042 RepID=UPI0025C4C5BC|nr:hypothetical protein [Chiayiivirga sp.]MCI1730474.1 hypothetical protein [Chiayiivirga sp.]
MTGGQIRGHPRAGRVAARVWLAWVTRANRVVEDTIVGTEQIVVRGGRWQRYGQIGYRRQRGRIEPTRPTAVQIGQRRRPQPGFLRVDSVHQGDFDGIKGLYATACAPSCCSCNTTRRIAPLP